MGIIYIAQNGSGSVWLNISSWFINNEDEKTLVLIVSNPMNASTYKFKGSVRILYTKNLL